MPLNVTNAQKKQVNPAQFPPGKDYEGSFPLLKVSNTPQVKPGKFIFHPYSTQDENSEIYPEDPSPQEKSHFMQTVKNSAKELSSLKRSLCLDAHRPYHRQFLTANTLINKAVVGLLLQDGVTQSLLLSPSVDWKGLFNTDNQNQRRYGKASDESFTPNSDQCHLTGPIERMRSASVEQKSPDLKQTEFQRMIDCCSDPSNRANAQGRSQENSLKLTNEQSIASDKVVPQGVLSRMVNEITTLLSQDLVKFPGAEAGLTSAREIKTSSSEPDIPDHEKEESVSKIKLVPDGSGQMIAINHKERSLYQSIARFSSDQDHHALSFVSTMIDRIVTLKNSIFGPLIGKQDAELIREKAEKIINIFSTVENDCHLKEIVEDYFNLIKERVSKLNDYQQLKNFIYNLENNHLDLINEIIDTEITKKIDVKEILETIKARLIEIHSKMDGIDKIFFEMIIHLVPSIPSSLQFEGSSRKLKIKPTDLVLDNGCKVFRIDTYADPYNAINERLFLVELGKKENLYFYPRELSDNERWDLMLKYHPPLNDIQYAIVNRAEKPIIDDSYLFVTFADNYSKNNIESNPYRHGMVSYKTLKEDAYGHSCAITMLQGKVYAAKVTNQAADGKSHFHFAAIAPDGRQYPVVYNGVYWIFEAPNSGKLDPLNTQSLLGSYVEYNASSQKPYREIQNGQQVYHSLKRNSQNIEHPTTEYPRPIEVSRENIKKNDGILFQRSRKRDYELSRETKKELFCEKRGKILSPVGNLFHEESTTVDCQDSEINPGKFPTHSSTRKRRLNNEQIRAFTRLFAKNCYPDDYTFLRKTNIINLPHSLGQLPIPPIKNPLCQHPEEPWQDTIILKRNLTISERDQLKTTIDKFNKNINTNMDAISDGGCITAFIPKDDNDIQQFSLSKYINGIYSYLSNEESNENYSYNIALAEESIQDEYQQAIKDNYNHSPLKTALNKKRIELEDKIKNLMIGVGTLESQIKNLDQDDQVLIQLDTVKCNILNYGIQLNYVNDRQKMEDITRDIVNYVYSFVTDNSVNFLTTHAVIVRSVFNALHDTYQIPYNENSSQKLNKLKIFSDTIYGKMEKDEQALKMIITASVYYFFLHPPFPDNDQVQYINQRYLEAMYLDPYQYLSGFVDEYDKILNPKGYDGLMFYDNIKIKSIGDSKDKFSIERKKLNSDEITLISKGIAHEKLSALNLKPTVEYGLFEPIDAFEIKIGEIVEQEFKTLITSYIKDDEIADFKLYAIKLITGNWILSLKTKFFNDLHLIENSHILEEILYKKTVLDYYTSHHQTEHLAKIKDDSTNSHKISKEIFDFYNSILSQLAFNTDKTDLQQMRDYAIKIDETSINHITERSVLSWLEEDSVGDINRLINKIDFFKHDTNYTIKMDGEQNFTMIENLLVDKINGIIRLLPDRVLQFDIERILSSDYIELQPHGEVSIDKFALFLDVSELIFSRLSQAAFLINPKVSIAASISKNFFSAIKIMYGTSFVNKSLKYLMDNYAPTTARENTLKYKLIKEMHSSPPVITVFEVSRKIPFSQDDTVEAFSEKVIKIIKEQIQSHSKLRICLHFSELKCDKLFPMIEDIFDDQFEIITPRILFFWKNIQQSEPSVRYVAILTLSTHHTINAGKLKFIIDLPIGPIEWRVSDEVLVTDPHNWQIAYSNKYSCSLIKYKDLDNMNLVEAFIKHIKGKSHNSNEFRELRDIVNFTVCEN